MRSDIIRDCLRARGGRIVLACFGAVALMTLPACSLDESGTCTTCFEPGSTPQSTVLFCDIEQPGTGFENTNRICADQVASSGDPRANLSLIQTTTAPGALNSGFIPGVPFSLEKSAADVNRCGANGDTVAYQGPFPQGTPVCMNASQIPGTYATPDAACVAKCVDMLIKANFPGDANVFCGAHAHASTSIVAADLSLYANACDSNGAFQTSFIDPRINPDPIAWDPQAAVNIDQTLKGTLDDNAFTGLTFGAAAASIQSFTHDDAVLEFSASPTNRSHLIGFSRSTGPLTTPVSFSDIAYAYELGNDNRVYIFANGAQQIGPATGGAYLESFSSTDRFRIHLTDRGNGQYDVRFTKVVGSCSPGTPCVETDPFVTVTDGATGPFRVEGALQNQGVTIDNIGLVWNKKQ